MAIQEINLLPPDRRLRVRNESIAVSVTYIIKSINAGLLLMSLLGGVIVASIWAYQAATTDTTKEELTVIVDEYQTLRDQVAEQNAVLERLASLGGQRIVWSEILNEFFAATPPGVTVQRFSGDLTFAEGVLTAGELMVAGRAAARPLLISYETQLKNLKHVVAVNSPTSNLLERIDPPFQFSLTLSAGE